MGFKLACNVHVWAYFEKIASFWKNFNQFLHKMACGLGQDISFIEFLVVSDLKACKRSGYSGSFWIAFEMGLNLGCLTLRYMEK